MAIQYVCDSCGKETKEIVKNLEEYGVEFCDSCRNQYLSELKAIEKKFEEQLEEAKAKIERKFGIKQKGFFAK